MKYLLTSEIQWSDHMEEILCIITINYNEEAIPARRVKNQATYPYIICDVSLPQRNTGYVY